MRLRGRLKRADALRARPGVRRDELSLTSGDVRYFGCGTIRIYGFGDFQPCGKIVLASSSLTEPAMMTSSPDFQSAGVATRCLAVSCSESITRNISWKLRPVVIG